MSSALSDDRSRQILDALAALIIRQGYDKTSMIDVAQEVGVSRGTVYLYFANKERLFEALVLRESTLYVEAWLQYVESNESVTSMGAIYRAVLHAVNSRPFMAAMLKHDRRIMGSYLRKPGNLFASLEAVSPWNNLLWTLQEVGAVRQDINPAVMTHIMDLLAYGLASADEFKPPGASPPFDATLEAIANMLDCVLTPADGGNRAAGREVIRGLAATFRDQFETIKQQWIEATEK